MFHNSKAHQRNALWGNVSRFDAQKYRNLPEINKQHNLNSSGATNCIKNIFCQFKVYVCDINKILNISEITSSFAKNYQFWTCPPEISHNSNSFRIVNNNYVSSYIRVLRIYKRRIWNVLEKSVYLWILIFFCNYFF